ncbi:hypothetical protein MPH_13939, partial [Macrophomina phaseolina MS6]
YCIWPKVVRLRQVGKERFFKSFQKTLYESIRIEKNQGGLDHHEPDMAVRHVRFISVREEHARKSILNYQSLRIRIIVRNQAMEYSSRCRPRLKGVEIVPYYL